MPLNRHIKRVLIFVEDEFDCYLKQACTVFRDCGIKVVLVSPNPSLTATVKTMAEKIYFEPVTLENIQRIIIKEQPDSILNLFWGERLMSICMQMSDSGFLKDNNIKLLGTEQSKNEKINALSNLTEDFKEVEFLLLRDKLGNALMVSSSEKVVPSLQKSNSIVVYPSISLSKQVSDALKQKSLDLMHDMEIVGVCSVEFAINKNNFEFEIKKIRPNLTMSNIYAGKVFGYPIIEVSIKLSLGFHLEEIKNKITGNCACIQPNVDYLALKLFSEENGNIVTIAHSFEATLMKALRGVNSDLHTLNLPKLQNLSDDELLNLLEEQSDQSIYLCFEALNRNVDVEILAHKTKIDKVFLCCMRNIVDMQSELTKIEGDKTEIYQRAKKMGFSDDIIDKFAGVNFSHAIKKLNSNFGYTYHEIDSCAGEYKSNSLCFYSEWSDACSSAIAQDKSQSKDKIVLLAPNQVVNGKHDYCSNYCFEQAVRILKDLGYQICSVGNNLLSLFTESDAPHKMYTESLCIEDIMGVINKEKPTGVMIPFGGEHANTIAQKLSRNGVKVLGTSTDSVDLVWDSVRFFQSLHSLGIDYTDLNENYNVVKDKFISVDAITDGNEVLILGFLQHSSFSEYGNSQKIMIYPSSSINDEVAQQILSISKKIVKHLKCKGLFQLCVLIKGQEVFVQNLILGASNNIPFLSKALELPVFELAIKAMTGKKWTDVNFGVEYLPYIADKVAYLQESQAFGIGKTVREAVLKAMLATDCDDVLQNHFDTNNTKLITLNDMRKSKQELRFVKMHGVGNDYVFVDCRRKELDSVQNLAVELSNRHFGIGSDGLVLILKSNSADAKMCMYNADGSEGSMCGNAIRCIAKYLFDSGSVKKTTMSIETASMICQVKLILSRGKAIGAKVTLESPKVVEKRKIIIEDIEKDVVFVNVGNDHCVHFVPNLSVIEFGKRAPLYQNHPDFMDKPNVEFVQIISKSEISIRVFERGSGETLACGSGACAAVVAAVSQGMCQMDSEITVNLLGGVLTVNYNEQNILLTGECCTVFSGIMEI
ncbi:MAG: diaminopimelate epimerase [Clostridiales bacterium]|jgi:diaminopimelate epimerase|nr:diaminopimelate epimerase [Clostridiales bacterium]